MSKVYNEPVAKGKCVIMSNKILLAEGMGFYKCLKNLQKRNSIKSIPCTIYHWQKDIQYKCYIKSLDTE